MWESALEKYIQGRNKSGIHTHREMMWMSSLMRSAVKRWLNFVFLWPIISSFPHLTSPRSYASFHYAYASFVKMNSSAKAKRSMGIHIMV